MKKQLLILILLAVLLSGCSNEHTCYIEAMDECGEGNVKYTKPNFNCRYECWDYSKFLNQ